MDQSNVLNRAADHPNMPSRSRTETQQPLLSVIIPVYNEERTLDEVLRRVTDLALDLEVLIVNDGSTDGTEHIIERWAGNERIMTFRHDSNRGKGSAIRTALPSARGRFTLIQDGDLEYDPDDYSVLLGSAMQHHTPAVYGTRTPSARLEIFGLGVRALNMITFVLYGQRLKDEATCYKLISTDLLKTLDLRCERFEFCTEVTSKLCKLGIEIAEVHISYNGRSFAEGKKIRWFDGVAAIASLLRWKLWKPSQPILDELPAPYAHQSASGTP